jgi:hypothetical protein
MKLDLTHEKIDSLTTFEQHLITNRVLRRPCEVLVTEEQLNLIKGQLKKIEEQSSNPQGWNTLEGMYPNTIFKMI